MSAILSDEQRHLEETAKRLAGDIAVTGPETLRSDPGSDWAKVVELGWPEMRIRDEAGQPLTSGVEVALIAEALGGRLTQVPFLVSAVLAVELAERAGAVARSGDTVALSVGLGALAGDGPAIAFDSALADGFLALRGEPGRREVIRGQLSGEAAELADLTRVAVRLSPEALAAAEPIGSLDGEAEARWTALALVGVAAEQLGLLQRAEELAVSYANERHQFGVPIGSFQAVSHACAEIHVRGEAARSAVWYAAWAVDALDPVEALRAARVAKAYCGSCGPAAVEAATQILGGIGVTWENEAHLLLRRMRLDRHLLGTERHQYAELRKTMMED